MNVNYLHVFSKEFLDRLYNVFHHHINRDNFPRSFFVIIEESLLMGDDWENISDVLTRLGANLTKWEVADFLEAHCYTVWFSKKFLEKHEFTFLEKSALAAWEFYCAEDSSEHAPETFIKELRSNASEEFVDKYFSEAIPEYVGYYQDFLDTEVNKYIN